MVWGTLPNQRMSGCFPWESSNPLRSEHREEGGALWAEEYACAKALCRKAGDLRCGAGVGAGLDGGGSRAWGMGKMKLER